MLKVKEIIFTNPETKSIDIINATKVSRGRNKFTGHKPDDEYFFYCSLAHQDFLESINDSIVENIVFIFENTEFELKKGRILFFGEELGTLKFEIVFLAPIEI